MTQGGRFALLAAGAALALGSSATPPRPAQPNQGGNQNAALAGVRGTTSSAPATSNTSSSNSNSGGNDLVTFEIEMDDSSDVRPVMRKAAKAYGCGAPKEEVDGGKTFFVVQCNESMLGVVQEGRKITFACEKARLDEEGCKQFVRRYVEAASDTTADNSGSSGGKAGFGNSGGKAGFGSGNSGNSGNGGGKAGFGNTNKTEDGTQSYTIDLESDDNVIPLFRDRLKKIGCEVPINAGNFIQASCHEGRVYVYQEKRKLTFNCEKMTSEQCGAILDRMQKAE